MKKYVLISGLPFLLLLSILFSGFVNRESMLGEVREKGFSMVFDKNLNDFSMHGNQLFLKGEVFSGWVGETYADGGKKSRTPYLEGVAHGWMRGWYRNGQLKSVRFYANGKKEGTHQGWWQNGCARFVGHFELGLTEGEFLEWYQDGSLFRWFHYVTGKENGRQQAWKSDGRIKANYVMKKGKRYGLAGVKGCGEKLN